MDAADDAERQLRGWLGEPLQFVEEEICAESKPKKRRLSLSLKKSKGKVLDDRSALKIERHNKPVRCTYG